MKDKASQSANLQTVFENIDIVVFQTRMISVKRDTGQGGAEEQGQINKIYQKCMDPAVMRPFNSVKTEAGRVCRNLGTKVEALNAWAVPTQNTPILLERLKELAERWNSETEGLACRIDSIVDEWANQNPATAETIRQLAPRNHEVRESTKFSYTSFKLKSDDVQDFGALSSDISDMPAQMLYEFSLTLKDGGLDRGKRGNYTPKVIDVFRRIEAKAKPMSFLHPIIKSVHLTCEDLINHIKSSDRIGPALAMMIQSVVDQMMAPNNLYRNGFTTIAPEVLKQAEETAKESVKAAKPTRKPKAVDAAVSAAAFVF